MKFFGSFRFQRHSGYMFAFGLCLPQLHPEFVIELIGIYFEINPWMGAGIFSLFGIFSSHFLLHFLLCVLFIHVVIITLSIKKINWFSLFFLLAFILYLPTHLSPCLHHSEQPKSILGLRTSFLQLGHRRMGSSFQNSISVRQKGQGSSKMSSGFQYRWS